jgi:shikimate dehydrogenase
MISLAVIGHPLKHTLSPIMHNAALEQMAIPGVYLPLEVNPDDLKNAVHGLTALGFVGYNVTIPFKMSIIPFLDDITEEARMVGAVNTVIIYPSRKTLGDNTDIIGFMETFSDEEKEFLKGKKASIIGSGGASRAVGAGLIKMGLSEINMYDIKPEMATATCEHLTSIAEGKTRITANEIASIDLTDIHLLVNASPVGMHPHDHQCPIEKEVLQKLDQKAIVFDLIYRPQKTVLLKWAAHYNLKTYNGAEMLVRQGARSLEKWVNQEVPVGLMREKVLEALENEV